MRVMTTAFESFFIYETIRAPGRGILDPITVLLRDCGGCGQIIVECYGDAWSHWFGSIGSKTLRKFIADIHDEYLATKLVSSTVRISTKREEDYVKDIARAVINAIKETS